MGRGRLESRQRTEENMKRCVSMASLLFVLGSGTLARTQSTHVMVTPASLTWTDGPPSLPAGSKVAVMAGDPTKAGLFAMRLKLTSVYRIPPQWHPLDVNLTVIYVPFNMGFGDKITSC